MQCGLANPLSQIADDPLFFTPLGRVGLILPMRLFVQLHRHAASHAVR